MQVICSGLLAVMKAAALARARGTWTVAVLAVVCSCTTPAQAPGGYLDVPTYAHNPTSAVYWDTASGDLDGDGRDDVVMAVGASILAFVSTPQGGVGSPVVTQFNGPSPGGWTNMDWPALADLDQDGALDLVVWDDGAGHRVFKGNGLGGFTHLADLLPLLPTPYIASRLTGITDLDGDSIPEVVLRSYIPQGSNTTDIHVITAIAGSFAYAGSYATTYWVDAQVADVNGDGFQDVVGLAQVPSASTVNITDVFIALGSGALTGFGPPTLVPLPSPNSGTVLVTADTDGNGANDLIFNELTVPTSVWAVTSPIPTYLWVCSDPFGSAAWSALPAPGFRGNNFGARVEVRDINGDGLSDLVGLESYDYNWPNPIAPRARVGVALGDGNGFFQPPQVMVLPSGLHHPTLGVADTDGDGDPDPFVLEYWSADIGLCRNQARFGVGCVGAGGIPPRIGAGLPAPGNAAFSVTVDGAPANALAVLGLSLARTSVAGPCQILIDVAPGNLLLPAGVLGVTATTPSGLASVSLPIPNAPFLVGSGLTAYAQWGVADGAAPSGVAFTSGAKLIVW